MASLEKARIYDSVEAFLAHHRHSVQHRHAVTRANAPPLVPEAAVAPPVPSPPPSPFPPADEDLVALPASPTPAELEDLCAELNDRAVREASEAGADAPARALRTLRAALRLHERARGYEKPNPKPAFSFSGDTSASASERKRRASVASALHGNAASILLDARLRDDERFPNAPRRALEHALLACGANVKAGADADAASADATYAAVAASGMARRLPHLSAFPAGAPEGAFIAHLEAAGAPRSYGLHPPCFAGTKVRAALAEVERVRAQGEKLVVFSDCRPVLEVLRDALRRTRGDGAVGLILGETNFEERMGTLARFNESPACCALLLSVQACASGLTLTAANHCLLLDLQSHEGRELQLVNRVWRIGQTKPVSVKRLVAAGTVEERMLHLRKRSKGLMASESDADQIAVSRVEEPAASGGGGGAPEQSERTEELRFLFNARVRAEA